MNQLGPRPAKNMINDEWTEKCIAQDEAAKQAFVKNDSLIRKPNIITSRVTMRMNIIQSTEQVSEDFII